MSIASELTALQGDITSARSAIVAKGGTVTSGGGSSQLATDIATIPASSGDLDGIVDGSITEFVMPAGKTEIKPYRFYQFTALTSADLRGCTMLGNYTFQGCTNLVTLTLPNALTSIGQYAFNGCTKITGLVLPASLTSIGQYAFQNVSTASGTTAFVFMPTGTCTIGSYGFSSAKISKLAGAFGNIGNYAFQNCSSLVEVGISASTGIGDYTFQNCSNLTKLHFKVNGGIGTYAFDGVSKASDVNFDKTSVVTSLSSYAFARFGSSRTSPSANRIVLDFTNSTFTSIPQYGFGYSSSSNKFQYIDVIFPTTVSSVSQYAFRYSDNCNFFFKRTTPPTLSATTCWNNATNYKIFVPYNNVNAYRTATNWTAQSSYIRGFSAEGTFSVGDTLPEFNDDGYALTWYSDKELTVAVTTVSDANAMYYCTVGTTKVVYKITSVGVFNCTVAITDGTKTYVAGDSVRTGTVLTITGSPTITSYIPYTFKVNGQDFTSGSTITVSSDVFVSAVYWDGEHVPVNPTFGDNGWDVIASTFKSGVAGSFWSVGDTKSVTLTNGQTYTVRIADMQSGRYAYADGTGNSHAVLEFVELQPTARYMNSTNTNAGGWAQCYMRSTVMTELYNLLPSDMRSAISEVNVLSGTGSSTTSGTSSSANKLFLPAEMEIFSAKTYSIGNTECPLGQFDWYRTHNTNADRIKYRSGSAVAWWLRSPYSGNSYNFCNVNSGVAASSGANYTYGVAPCFAI